MTRHLLHIGYPKAGSTYLQRWFTAHPQLAYREGGVAGFHNVYQIAREGTSPHAEPVYRVTSNESLALPSGDVGLMQIDYEGRLSTDIVEAQNRVCRSLAGLFPDAVVLIVTRGFRSMILSTYSQFVRSGGHVSLADLVELVHSAKADLVTPWDYDRLIATYTAAFGAENVVVMPYELLRDDARAFTRALAERLAIEPFGADFGRVNESLSPVEMAWYPRVARVMRRIPSRRMYGLYVRASFGNRLRKPVAMLQRLRPRAEVTADAIPDETINLFRGRASSLRAHPLFTAYAADYLNQ